MNIKTLAWKAKRQARIEFRKGNLDKATYDHIIKAVKNRKVLTEWAIQIDDARLDPWNYRNSSKGLSISNILDWFAENWSTILRILLTILPLLIIGDDNEDSLP